MDNDDDDAVSVASAGASEPAVPQSAPSSMDHVVAIPNAQKVLTFLHAVFGLCQQVRDRPRACLHAHARLHQTFLRIAHVAKLGSLRSSFRFQHYLKILDEFKAVLHQHLKLSNLVAKATASRQLLSGLAKVHSELNALLVENALTSATSPLLEWKHQFAANRRQDEAVLHETLVALLSTAAFVRKELPSDRHQALVLLELLAEVAPHESPRGHSSQLLETLKMAHRRISTLCDLSLTRVPKWFVPGYEVNFSRTDHTIGYARGSFGSTLQRGEAFRYTYSSERALSSATSTVAVKCLWALPDVHYQYLEQLFERGGVSKWTRVRHPNVVTIRGASHAVTPPYLVRDFTTYGGLTTYLEALGMRAKECAGSESCGKLETLTWQLLYGASRGLLHLHEQHNIVHGGLRCNNILVDKKGRAVIADYGLYTLACDARDSGLIEHFQLDVLDTDVGELIRWQAPECLGEHMAYRESLRSLSNTGSALVSSSSVSASATAFATDVFAFGMCILEALTHAVPWAGIDIAKVRTLKENKSPLPPRPRQISSQAWSLIEKMCAADPLKRISLSEASQELKRLGYGNRVSNHSHSNSSKRLAISEASASAKVDHVLNSLDEVSRELIHLSSSTKDLRSLETDAIAEVEHVFTSLEEASEELQNIQIRASNGLATDMGELEDEASQKLVRVLSRLNIASQELKRLGMGDKATSGSQNSALHLVQEARENLVRLASDKASSIVAQQREILFSNSDQGQMADDGSVVYSAATRRRLPLLPVNIVDETVAIESDEQLDHHLGDIVASRDCLAVDGTGPPYKGSVPACGRYSSNIPDARSGMDEGSLLEPAAKESANAWDSPQEWGINVARSHDIVRSRREAQLDKQNDVGGRNGHELTAKDDRTEMTSVTDVDNYQLAHEQPEQEMDNDIERVKIMVVDDDCPGLLSCDEGDEVSEGLTSGESSMDEEMLMIVPAEFQTARSFDEGDLASPLHPVVGLLESLRMEQPDNDRFVETLEAMKEALEVSTARIIVEREGLLTLMELVWRDYSEACTRHALELLQSIAGLGPEFVTTLVESKVVKILLAVVKHRSSPQQVDLAASLLLDIIAEDDDAKRQLWTYRGVGVMEDACVINKRLVQEVKSTMAKFKRNEGMRCLEDGEFHLAIDKFTEAISLDRKRAIYYGDRSLAYMEASMFKKAADDAYRCKRYNPYDVMGYLRHGLALRAMGKYKEAMETLRKGTEVDPKFVKIFDALTETKQLYKARTKGVTDGITLRRMTAAESAKLKKRDGDDALRKKDYAFAIECYSEALELDPKNDWVYLHRSIAYAAQKDHVKAAEDASKCIRLNYHQVEGYYRLALALHAAGQHDQALSTLYRGQEVNAQHVGISRFIVQLEGEEAKKAGLSLPVWFKEKGFRAFQLRSYEDAIKFYTKAIDASLSDDDEVVMHCYSYRSRASQTRGDFPAVVADCTYVLDRFPENVFARLRRADAYEQQRDFLMALKDIRELIAINPDYEDAHARLQSLKHKCRLLPGASQHTSVGIGL
ncbi:unnamed protein product [Hyaloperonospora brassicae]|uniref:Protein kinase domain-containing protein n=1 Tax=Hyaloperonospora brassicae TaxID=162125 RepID=A0AAV0UIS5_HYABA|nr:unnamed protein product [Hyaloperonospora brassicae]